MEADAICKVRAVTIDSLQVVHVLVEVEFSCISELGNEERRINFVRRR